MIIQKTVFVKTLLGDFNAKVRREDILKPAIGNENVCQNSNDNGVTIVTFATSKKSSCYEQDVPTPKHS